MVDDTRAEGTFSGFTVNKHKFVSSVLLLGLLIYRHSSLEEKLFFKSPKHGSLRQNRIHSFIQT